jgi:hypothetical protein
MGAGRADVPRPRGNWAERYNWDIVPEPTLAATDDRTGDSATLAG